MRTSTILASLVLLFSTFFLHAQRSVQLKSPNGKIKFELQFKEKYPQYTVSFDKQPLIANSPLSLEFEDGWFGEHLKVGKPAFRTVKESYDLVVGKASHIESESNEVVVTLEEKNAPFRKVNLVVRAFDDGVAFRYEFLKQENKTSFTLMEERTTFNVVGNPTVQTLFLPSYTTSHEGFHTRVPYNELKEQNLMDMPNLFEFPNHVFMAITEAAIRDYAGMYLWKEDGILRGKLSPKPGQERIKVEGGFPHRSPWRVMIIADRVGGLIESNMLTNLNEPSKIEDTSWLKPGKTTFTWWNGNMVPDTTFAPGNNFNTNKYYIDFAAKHGIQYHSIYGYAEQPWYLDDGFDFGTPGKNVDITKSIKPLDMKYISDYAQSQGVDIHVWVNWKALYAKLDEAFAQFETWGIKGMMVDFMDRNDQEMIQIQEEMLAKAAKHHLFIQFHGSSKPSGLHRTYPNEFTREGTLNYEVYKWDNTINADHDITMPFTRMLAGATDYHLGGFRAVTPENFEVHYTHPLVTSTRCHMLAMYVVLESYLSMVADTPYVYEGQPGFEFIKQVPSTWDETYVPLASVNEYAVIARRKRKEWYVGALNNSSARNLELKLDFLGEGNFEATIFTDAKDVDQNPNHLEKQVRKVTSNDVIELPLAASGGATIMLRPAN